MRHLLLSVPSNTPLSSICATFSAEFSIARCAWAFLQRCFAASNVFLLSSSFSGTQKHLMPFSSVYTGTGHPGKCRLQLYSTQEHDFFMERGTTLRLAENSSYNYAYFYITISVSLHPSISVPLDTLNRLEQLQNVFE